MKHKGKLEEEVEFWLCYITRWEATHNKPVPERVQLLLESALLKLADQYSSIKKSSTLAM